MSEGFVPAWRQMFDPDHWLAPTKVAPESRRGAWMDLFQMATHQPRKVRDQELGVGELIVSIRTLADRWCWSKSRVGRFVDELESRTAIETVRGTPLGTIYRVVNYETYAIQQDGERDRGRDTKRDRSGTGAGQEQQLNNKTNTTKEGGLKRASALPNDWVPTASHWERADEIGLDLAREVEKFRLHAETNERKAKNWNSAFTNWLIKAEEFAKPRKNGKHRSAEDRWKGM